MREGVLLNGARVHSGNSATGVDIVAEVRACDGLDGLRLAQIGVAIGHNSTRIDVSDEDSHLRPNDIAAVSR